MAIKALFLDRDGVVNIDRHYVYRVEDFEWTPGIFALCRAAKEKGYEVFIITNQSGIARGYYSEDDFHHLTASMTEGFAAEGVELSDVFFCPHLEHEDRKPNPGMFLKAARKHDIDMAASVNIGDNPRDIEAGAAAGVARNYLFDPEGKKPYPQAAGRFSSLADIIPFL